MSNLCSHFFANFGLQSYPKSGRFSFGLYCWELSTKLIKFKMENLDRALCPTWCSLCKCNGEDSSHLFISCLVASFLGPPPTKASVFLGSSIVTSRLRCSRTPLAFFLIQTKNEFCGSFPLLLSVGLSGLKEKGRVF